MSIDLEKTSRIIELFETYGEILAEKQKLYLSSYYLYDLSLAEIAEEFNISRASVLDTLKQGVKKLEEFETKLHLLEKKKQIKEVLRTKTKKSEIVEEIERIL